MAILENSQRETSLPFDRGFPQLLWKSLSGLLLAVLSFSAVALYDRIACAEQDIVQLRIVDAARSEQIVAMNKKLDRIETKLDRIIDGKAP